MKRSDKITLLVIHVLTTSFGILGWFLLNKCAKENEKLVNKYNELVKEYNKLVDDRNKAAQLAFDSLCDGMEMNIANMDMIENLLNAIENRDTLDPEIIQSMRNTVRESKGSCYRNLRDLAK